MKLKLLLLAFSLLGLSATASAQGILFEDFVELNETLGGTGNPDSDVFAWTHDTPDDFTVPFDIVHEATLEIRARRYNSNNEYVTVEGTVYGTLRDNRFVLDDDRNSEFDIADVFASWDGGEFNVELDFSERPDRNNLRLVSSRFSLNYSNRTGSGDAPAPAALAVVLAVMGGGAMLRRKRQA